MGQPRQQRTETGAAQDLLDGPQPIRRLSGLHDDQIVEIDAEGAEGRCVGYVRRPEEEDDLARPGEVLQDRDEQAQFTDPGLTSDELDWCAGRPTAPWQLGIQGAEPAGQTKGEAMPELVGSPDARGQSACLKRRC